MRWLAAVLIALIAAIQYPMWLGKGVDLRARLGRIARWKPSTSRTRLELRNGALAAEVRT